MLNPRSTELFCTETLPHQHSDWPGRKRLGSAESAWCFFERATVSLACGAMTMAIVFTLGISGCGNSSPETTPVPIADATIESESQRSAASEATATDSREQSEPSGEHKSGGNQKTFASVGDMVDGLGNAVVFLTAYDALNEEVGTGTGCFIDPYGHVATNYHVVEDAVRLSARLKDGRELVIRGYCRSDKSRDLAILEAADVPADVPHFEIPDAPALRQGDRMIAIGHPLEFSFTVS
ncbi:MAG: trypsin-like peptidase domain-containing protein, partial [Planctomycetaceae bacterium]|nr:trypsin-like peptidase domain-containing protein [Planctomycetaceae bacterium]